MAELLDAASWAAAIALGALVWRRVAKRLQLQ
jgi:hypothetical protein